MTDDPGVMGNLPRSRPGRRSEKRAGGAAAGKRTATGGAGAARKPKGAAQSRTSGGARAGQARRKPPVATPAHGPDPVGDVVRIAAKVAGTGLGIAAGIVKRLPRP